jgi:hypothetical protein
MTYISIGLSGSTRHCAFGDIAEFVAISLTFSANVGENRGAGGSVRSLKISEGAENVITYLRNILSFEATSMPSATFCFSSEGNFASQNEIFQLCFTQARLEERVSS